MPSLPHWWGTWCSFKSLEAQRLAPVRGFWGFPGDSVVKNLSAMQETRAGMQETWAGSLGWEDSPGGGHGNPLQYSCLENSVDRGAWQGTVHGIAQSRTQLKWLSSSRVFPTAQGAQLGPRVWLTTVLLAPGQGQSPPVMLNSVWPFDWVTPIFDQAWHWVSVRMFLDELDIQTGRLKADFIP